jgi:hypothetical protein
MALVRRFGRDRRPAVTATTAGTSSTATETLAAVYDPSVVVQDTNPFIHVAFSSDGCDLVATTRTKLLRFPLSGAAAAEGLAWSALLPARCALVTTHLPTSSTSASQQQQQWSVLCAPEHTTATAAALTTAATAVDGASQGELLLLGARCGGAAGPAAVALSAAQSVAGHNRAVTAAAFSQDGQWAVTGDCSGVVAVRRRLQRAAAPVAPATSTTATAAATAAGDGSHWEERYTVSSTPSAATTVTDAAAVATAARSAAELEGNGASPARATPFARRQQAWTPVSQQQQSQQQQQQQPLVRVEVGLLGGAAPVALHAAMAAVSVYTVLLTAQCCNQHAADCAQQQNTCTLMQAIIKTEEQPNAYHVHC